MPRDRQSYAGPCEKCGGSNMTCSVNLYDGEDEWIVSWEHRCLDCAMRDTRAYRSTDEEVQPREVTHVCPFCGRSAPEG